MVLADSYPLGEVLWTIVIFFAFVIWIWLLWIEIGDILRRTELSGWGKVGWIVVLCLIPYFGVFIYLIVEHKGMSERIAARRSEQQQEMDQYVRSVASEQDRVGQIAAAKRLLDEGTIDQAEFERIKATALSG
ncbi:MAG TPA: PLDc N-terminal domain-containing protein [Solirubrobacteraceae bacterium]|nr:PLDc N-terminal domain-containing protein [Solirubrobacteraceae bacterium]